MKKNQKGITLVSMVITIIVMLILAGVSISAAIGDDGVATRGSDAAVKTKLAKIAEDFNLATSNIQMAYEADKIEASTISAYQNIYATVEKYNDILKESKILIQPTGNGIPITLNNARNQRQIVGTQPNLSADLLGKVYNAGEHPLSQLLAPNNANFTAINSAANPTPTTAVPNPPKPHFTIYLSNGKDGSAINTDVYVAVCKFEKGMPILMDLGLVGEAPTTNLRNGVLTVAANGNVSNGNASLTQRGVLPTQVRWLNEAMGLTSTD